ncbi:MAG: glycosyltransferase [Verrucomicrobia bacterium]|nr:glycosyltransferase [Verrucomicrobiota bacterium]MDE3099855.1 glycosyltransferase [Verrucomicrobiota bacterium]
MLPMRGRARKNSWISAGENSCIEGLKSLKFQPVDHRLPRVTVVVAARPGQAEVQALNAARSLDYPAELLEIIVARGRQPSVQRNAALRAARGEWIYFLDDDSVPLPGNLKRAAVYFPDPKVKMIGGPNVCPPDAPPLEKIFAAVLSSWLAFGPSRARYAALGSTRDSGEKELILCNLAARRDALTELGGFNESLYPNEENALMDDLKKRGGRLIYDPEFSVHRRPRRTLKAFFKMLMTYGRGRAEQFRVNPTPASAPNFVPPLFCLYLLFLLIFVAIPGGAALTPWKWWSAAPLAAYACAVILQTLLLIPANGLFKGLAAGPLLAAGNILYGIGFWRGLFTKLRPSEKGPQKEVTLEKF